ncbi:hypothetical protein THAOC_04224, partial [Thalassiosira oceanica]
DVPPGTYQDGTHDVKFTPLKPRSRKYCQYREAGTKPQRFKGPLIVDQVLAKDEEWSALRADGPEQDPVAASFVHTSNRLPQNTAWDSRDLLSGPLALPRRREGRSALGGGARSEAS